MGAVGTGIVTDVTDCPEVKPGEGQVITATFRHPPSTDVLDVTFVDESTWLSGKGRESSSAENQAAGTERVGSLFRPDDSQSSETGDPKKTPDPVEHTGTVAADSSFTPPPSSLDSIGVTDNHLFWSVDRQQFVPIGEMEIGERVQTYHGETKRIASKLPRPGPPKEVYNLEVYGEHVYFVGEQGILVHNNYVARRVLKHSEASGGHAIGRHLGKTRGYLKSRGKALATSFRNRKELVNNMLCPRPHFPRPHFPVPIFPFSVSYTRVWSTLLDDWSIKRLQIQRLERDLAALLVKTPYVSSR